MNYRGIAKSFDGFTKEEKKEISKEPHHIEFYTTEDGHYMTVRPYKDYIKGLQGQIER